MIYIIEFFLFAFLGWIIDSSYCSLWHKKLVISGYFKGYPFCPIYGFGGILLLNTFALMNGKPAWQTIILATLLITVLEFVGGWFAEYLLEEKLWDYSKEPLNLGGYISAWHSFLWLVVVSVSYLLIGDKSYGLVMWFDSLVVINKNLEVLLVLIVISFVFWATIENKKLRLSKLAKEQIEKIKSLEELMDFDKFKLMENEKLKEVLSNRNISSLHKRIEEIKNNFKH